jgi:hypothetical protein
MSTIVSTISQVFLEDQRGSEVNERSNSNTDTGASIADEDVQTAIVDDDVLAEVKLAQKSRESVERLILCNHSLYYQV